MNARTQPARRLALIAGLVVTAASVTWATVQGAAWMSRQTTTSVRPLGPDINRVEIGSVNGTATIVGRPGQAQIVEKIRTGLTTPATSLTISGTTLRYAGRCSWWDEVCRVSPEFTLDSAAQIQGSASSGDVHLRSLTGPVTLDLGSGDIDAQEVDGELELSTGSGDVRVRDSASPLVTARSDSGDVRVELSSEPSSVDAASDSGEVVVVVPAGSGPYRVDASADSGDVDVQVRTDPSSTKVIRAAASSGDVTVRYPG